MDLELTALHCFGELCTGKIYNADHYANSYSTPEYYLIIIKLMHDA